ncbi:MAG: hypothetical protein J1F09_03400 [Oscillospiraceae bacterium]|nr:hypothetical protein [Oscillospiraceae bacterium]
MKTKKTKEAEEMYRIIFLDFKDELKYGKEIEGFKEMSAVQKWFIYDKYAKSDADVAIKRNKLLASVLGWSVTHLDAIFPVRQIIKTLLKTIGQEIDVDQLLDGKKEIYDIIDGKALTAKLHDAGEAHVRSWHNFFSEQLEKLCRNVHTVGNYMPCPDENYNSVKGFKGKWHYNDRIDLLYSDILEPRCKKENNEYIISPKQRNDWKDWFDKNKENLFLTEILDGEIRDELGKFGYIKKTDFSDEELKELPEYLKTINILIECRTGKIKAKCAEAVQNIFFECYKNTLSEFEHGKVFLQVTSFTKGYIWVAPECEKKFEDGEFGRLFDLEIHKDIFKHFNDRPIDKEVGEASWANMFEYSYLALYDCYIDHELSAYKNWSIDSLKNRAAYFAFKELDLAKDYRPHYESEDDPDE